MNTQSQLWLNDSGLNTREIEDALCAAYTSLKSAGFTTDQAHEAAIQRANDQRFDQAAADAWDNAETEALNAVGGAREAAILVLA